MNTRNGLTVLALGALGLAAFSMPAEAGDRTRIIVDVADGGWGLGLGYRDGWRSGPSYGLRLEYIDGYYGWPRQHRRYDERYRYRYPDPWRYGYYDRYRYDDRRVWGAPPGWGRDRYGYSPGYRHGYRDGYRDHRYDRRRDGYGSWDRHRDRDRDRYGHDAGSRDRSWGNGDRRQGAWGR